MTDLSRLRAYDEAHPFREARAKLRTKGGSRKKDSEAALHFRVVVMLRKRLPQNACFLHPANGSSYPAQRLRQARMGAMPGAPDLMIIHDGAAFGIELKVSRGTVSDNQHWAHGVLRNCGCPVAVCRTIEEVEAFLQQQGVNLRPASAAGRSARAAE